LGEMNVFFTFGSVSVNWPLSILRSAESLKRTLSTAKSALDGVIT